MKKKHSVYKESVSSDSEKLKQKQKGSKRPKRISMKPWLRNRNDKSSCVNIFSELLLINKFRHDLRMNATSYY